MKHRKGFNNVTENLSIREHNPLKSQLEINKFNPYLPIQYCGEPSFKILNLLRISPKIMSQNHIKNMFFPDRREQNIIRFGPELTYVICTISYNRLHI